MNMFAFNFDYANFDKTEEMHKKVWTIYSNSTRVKTIKNKTNNTYRYEDYNLTNGLKELFDKYQIDTKKSDLKEDILNIDKLDFYKELTTILRLMLQMKNSIPNSDVNYFVSPVLNNKGEFFDTRNCDANLPKDVCANGAYNLARKALWGVKNIKATKDIEDATTVVKKKEWLKFVQDKPVTQ